MEIKGVTYRKARLKSCSIAPTGLTELRWESGSSREKEDYLHRRFYITNHNYVIVSCFGSQYHPPRRFSRVSSREIQVIKISGDFKVVMNE